MALPVGTKAPDFALSSKNPEGVKLVRLSDNFGKKNTLLLFFPAAFTGVCTSELCTISVGLNDYEGLNAAVYGQPMMSLMKASCRVPVFHYME
jgi:glutaredoxin-dependent peroxiredoxin